MNENMLMDNHFVSLTSILSIYYLLKGDDWTSTETHFSNCEKKTEKKETLESILPPEV